MMSPNEGSVAAGRRPRRRTLLTVFGALTGMALTVVPLSTANAAGAATSSAQGKGTRVSAWSPSMTTGGPSFSNQTIRMVVHSSVAGSGARITLSNRYSTTALDVTAVDVAVQASGGEATRGTTRNVTFGASRHVTIPAGEEAVSDAIPISVSAGENLLVSLYVPGTTGMST